MATNSYFTQGTTGEQDLIENLVIEQIKMFGKNVFYMPRTLVNEDTTFTEDGSVNNIGIFGKGKKFQMISFGSDWNFDTSSDNITSYKAKDLVSNNIEDLFVQDLNNDSFI